MGLGGVSYFNGQSNYTTLLDDQGAVSYVGKAALNSSTNTPVWQIRKISQNGTVLSILYAEGNDNFDNVWDDRASLVYS